jgi:hypothetical protein
MQKILNGKKVLDGQCLNRIIASLLLSPAEFS